MEQEGAVEAESAPASSGASYRSLDIGVGGSGLSLGNSRRWKGLRINLRASSLDSSLAVIDRGEPFFFGGNKKGCLAESTQSR